MINLNPFEDWDEEEKDKRESETPGGIEQFILDKNKQEEVNFSSEIKLCGTNDA